MTDNQKLCTIHVINYLAIIAYFVTGSFMWWHLPLMLVSIFLILNIGIICGYHRYFTHSSFKTSMIGKLVMLYFGTIASVGAVIGWVAVHRKHHRYSDESQDPHSPKYKGFLKVWFGYFFNIYQVEGKYGAKLVRDKEIMWFQKYYYLIILLTVIPILLISPVLFVVLYSLPQIVSLNATSAINVLTHITGEVKDSKVLAALIFGEGWHATHHKQPLLSRLHKYDIAGITIEKLLEKRI